MPARCFVRSNRRRSVPRARPTVALARRPPSASPDHARLLDPPFPVVRNAIRETGDADFLVGVEIRRTWSLLLGVGAKRRSAMVGGFFSRMEWSEFQAESSACWK